MRSPWPFWINPVNHQSAVTEVSDESILESIFEIAGRNAHLPSGGTELTSGSICKPYVSSADDCCPVYASFLLLLAFFAGLVPTS